MTAPFDGVRGDERKRLAEPTGRDKARGDGGVYISLEKLSEWRADAVERSSRADAHLVFAARILSLIDALEAPCGSCHPCNNWANQTWVNAGERLPHLHEWQEMKAELAALAGVIADAKAETRLAWDVHSETVDRLNALIAMHSGDAVFERLRAERAEAALADAKAEALREAADAWHSPIMCSTCMYVDTWMRDRAHRIELEAGR